MGQEEFREKGWGSAAEADQAVFFWEGKKSKGLNITPQNNLSIVSPETFRKIILEVPKKHELVKRELELVEIDKIFTVIFRDVIQRHGVGNSALVKEVWRQISSNFSRPLSVNKLYNSVKSMGHSVSKDMLYSLVDWIEDTMYVFYVQIHSRSARARTSNPRKPYLIDHSLCLGAIEDSDRGWVLENIVAVELFRRGFSFSYYKKERKCDFIAEDRVREKRIAVQVSLDLGDSRELEGLVEAMDSVKADQGIIVTKAIEMELSAGNRKIKVVPCWKFLLWE